MKHVPLALIYLRLILGLAMFAVSLYAAPYFKSVVIPLLAIGLLSDIFDGVIARRFGIATEKLRRLDSTIDQVFWCLVAISAFVQYPGFFQANAKPIGILLGLEVLTYIISYARFGKEVATHAISSKIWTLFLFAALAQILYTGSSGLMFWLCIYIGVITRLENAAILLVLPRWANDVPSLYHAWKLRQNI